MFANKNDRRTPSKSARNQQVAVLGLGRFGRSLALELMAEGAEVLGIDADEALVQRYADDLTRVAVADTTDPEALQQLDIPSFERVVVAIGTNLEASILTTSVLVDFNISNIWAKAITRQHGQILSRVGANHVVLPEHDMGERVAHLVVGRMLDYIEFEDDFAMVKIIAPEHTLDRPLKESRLRTRYGVTVVGVKASGQEFTYATEETVPRSGDLLIVSGRVGAVQDFSNAG